MEILHHRVLRQEMEKLCLALILACQELINMINWDSWYFLRTYRELPRYRSYSIKRLTVRSEMTFDRWYFSHSWQFYKHINWFYCHFHSKNWPGSTWFFIVIRFIKEKKTKNQNDDTKICKSQYTDCSFILVHHYCLFQQRIWKGSTTKNSKISQFYGLLGHSIKNIMLGHPNIKKPGWLKGDFRILHRAGRKRSTSGRGIRWYKSCSIY